MDSFGGLLQARSDGHARSIGVSNFTEEYLSMVIDLTFITPAVNQIELHPLLNQDEMRKANAQHNVVTQSYTPLALGRLMDNPTVTSVAGEYGKTPAQVLLRWNLQLGNAVIFRSANGRAHRQQLRRLRFRVGRRAHGRHQRAQRRHPAASGPGHLRRLVTSPTDYPVGQVAAA